LRFWDASAVVPLLVDESTSRQIEATRRSDPDLLVWWTTSVECVSALVRRRRSGHLTATGFDEAVGLLDESRRNWAEVEPGEAVRQAAWRLLRVHDLRAGDALQLAAALVAADGRPETLELVTLDDRLADAAALEGFPLLRG
jgi:predicted nucleic acid-binding protein